MSERTPLSPGDTSPGRGWVKRRSLRQDEQSPTQKTGEPPQEPEEHRPEERWAPTQGLAFRYPTRYTFDIGRLLAQLEVDDEHAGLRLPYVGGRWYFLTWTPAVACLLCVSGGVLVLVPSLRSRSLASIFGIFLQASDSKVSALALQRFSLSDDKDLSRPCSARSSTCLDGHAENDVDLICDGRVLSYADKDSSTQASACGSCASDIGGQPASCCGC